MTGPINFKAVVHENERAAVTLAAQTLADSLTKASGEPITVNCCFDESLQILKDSQDAAIVMTSLLSEADNFRQPWPEVESRLRADYEILAANPSTVVFVITVFRHVPNLDAEQRELLRVRIRRLGRLAAEISREFGVMVVDIDRDFADVGARRLQTDYRLGGEYAKLRAAKSIALAVISAGLDEYVPFEIQDAARLIVTNDGLGYAAPIATEVKPSNLLSLGTGRHRQAVKTIVDTNSEGHAGWLVHLLLSGQISLGDAYAKLRGSIARRGLRASVSMLFAAARISQRGEKKLGRQG
jgi:hypothetical protein